MELGPERLEDKDKKEFVENLIQRTKQDYIRVGKEDEFQEEKVRDEANVLAEARIHRKDILFSHKNEEGSYITESRPDLIRRLGLFYDTVIDNLPRGEKALIITSSGCIDVSPSYFRYLEQGKKGLEIKNQKKIRGKAVIIKSGIHNGNFCYLNDSQKLDTIINDTKTKIKELRELSLDKIIDEKGIGIVETPLLGFKKEGEKYVHYKEKLDYALTLQDPIILFGDRKSTRLNSSHTDISRMPSSA